MARIGFELRFLIASYALRFILWVLSPVASSLTISAVGEVTRAMMKDRG